MPMTDKQYDELIGEIDRAPVRWSALTLEQKAANLRARRVANHDKWTAQAAVWDFVDDIFEVLDELQPEPPSTSTPLS